MIILPPPPSLAINWIPRISTTPITFNSTILVNHTLYPKEEGEEEPQPLATIFTTAIIPIISYINTTTTTTTSSNSITTHLGLRTCP